MMELVQGRGASCHGGLEDRASAFEVRGQRLKARILPLT